jgi:glycosyltransferase involved in cell wall biosynthesis
MKKLSIIIPCYNEAKSLPALVEEIVQAVDRDDVEVILVNNGSQDDTENVLEEVTKGIPYIRVVTVPVNQGYGYGILEGLKAGNGEYLGWIHGDLQTPFRDTLAAIHTIESSGNRKDIYVKGSRSGRPLLDQFFTLGMSVFESLLLGEQMSDINAQPNIFHRSFFQQWNNPPHDFSLDLFSLYTAQIEGIEVVRIPVLFPPRRHGHSHWNFGFKSRIKFIVRTVKYSLELEKKIGIRKTISARLRHLTFLKYLLAGGVAGIIHLCLLYVFTDILHIYYLISTSAALFIVFWISFFLQKYWTFVEKSSHRIKTQATHYFVMHTFNFVANGALMYLFVSILGVWYMLSQIVISLSIACVTFFINKKFIFSKNK